MADFVDSQGRIPKRIIQTGKSSQLPLKDRAAVCNLRLLNPDFEYLFFDDRQVEEFIRREFPEYLATYEGFPFRIQRYDFFRYLAVYRYGGFYFDLDVFLASGLSDLLEHASVFPFEGLTFSRLLRKTYGIDWQVGNYAFGAMPEHPFLEAVIQNCVKAQKDQSWVKPMMDGAPWTSRQEFYVLNTTGPGLLTRTLAEDPRFAATVSVLFPEDVCDPNTWNRFGDFGIHLMQASWRTQRHFLTRRLAMFLEARTMRRLIRESRTKGVTRRHGPECSRPLVSAGLQP